MRLGVTIELTPSPEAIITCLADVSPAPSGSQANQAAIEIIPTTQHILDNIQNARG